MSGVLWMSDNKQPTCLPRENTTPMKFISSMTCAVLSDVDTPKMQATNFTILTLIVVRAQTHRLPLVVVQKDSRELKRNLASVMIRMFQKIAKNTLAQSILLARTM